MSSEPRGRDLFIVDNSVSGWTGLRYLEEWAGIAKSFDIATGYFEIGALLALDGKWQPLEKMRILMGAEMTHRTRKALLDAVLARAVTVLDESIEANKDSTHSSMGFRGSSRRSDRGRSIAASTTERNFTQRRISLTPSLRWSAHKRWWDRATTRGPA